MLITLEGLDGSGKSTLAKEIARSLPEMILTKEPGSVLSALGPMLRELVLNHKELSPIERELLFYVDASQHAKAMAKQPDALYVSDRGLWSHLAYLRGYLKTKQIDWAEYANCKNIISMCCASPDYIIYLRGDLSLMKERNANKTKDVIESNGEVFYGHVLETYEDLVKSQTFAGKVLVLDATDSVDTNLSLVLDWFHGRGVNQKVRQ